MPPGSKPESSSGSPRRPAVRTCTTGPTGSLYPAHFCRDCGQEYHPVWYQERHAPHFLPREIDDTTAESDNDLSPGFLAPKRTRQDFKGEVADFPDSWLDNSRDEPVLRAQYRTRRLFREAWDRHVSG